MYSILEWRNRVHKDCCVHITELEDFDIREVRSFYVDARPQDLLVFHRTWNYRVHYCRTRICWCSPLVIGFGHPRLEHELSKWRLRTGM